MKTIKLNNGIEMPMVGFGTYQTDPEIATDNVCRPRGRVTA